MRARPNGRWSPASVSATGAAEVSGRQTAHMSSDIEHFYVQRSEPLGPLLPADVPWEHDGEEHIAGRDEWQLLIDDCEPRGDEF